MSLSGRFRRGAGFRFGRRAVLQSVNKHLKCLGDCLQPILQKAHTPLDSSHRSGTGLQHFSHKSMLTGPERAE